MKPDRGHGQAAAGGLSVLSVEPYGMKRRSRSTTPAVTASFSALGRAVWDETRGDIAEHGGAGGFQCSRSSRMG